MILFNKKNVDYLEKKLDWKKVVHLGVQYFVKKEKATWELEKAILEITEQLGAYYVLEQGLALVHAPVGDYVKEVAVYTIISKEKIVFNNQEDKWAKIIVFLASPDNLSHMQYIQEFGTIFGNDKLKRDLLNVSSLDEFWNVLKKD